MLMRTGYRPGTVWHKSGHRGIASPLSLRVAERGADADAIGD
jgi:hypothetical protein